MKQQPKHLRPREKLLQIGVENLTMEELYALILRSGNRGRPVEQLARKVSTLMKKHNHTLSPNTLRSLNGMGIAKATTVLAAIELGRRLFSPSTLLCISSAEQILPLVSEIISSRQEHLIALYLNARSELIHKALISKGTATASIAHPRDILWPAIERAAVHIILVHNHPSGSLIPSQEDLEMTHTIRQCAELLGFSLLDHIIVSKEGHRSIG